MGSDLLRITSDTRSGTLTSDPTQPMAEAFTSTEARHVGRYSVQALEDTLDYMHEHGEPFLEGYMLCSAFERFEGGQGLVQFCYQLHRKDEFVIKCAPPALWHAAVPRLIKQAKPKRNADRAGSTPTCPRSSASGSSTRRRT